MDSRDSWLMRCQLFTCCLSRTSYTKHELASIAETLSTLFYKYDLVPSDILTGLLLVREKQRRAIRQALVRHHYVRLRNLF